MNDRESELLEKALHDEATPSWGRVLLIVLRDDHRELHQHLHWHEDAAKTIWWILVPVVVVVVTSVAVALLKWLPSVLP